MFERCPFTLRFLFDDGIVVLRSEGNDVMEVNKVAAALQERLGPEATAGLLALFDTARQEWTAEVTIAAVERFERRLTEEISGVRVALAQSEGGLRKDFSEFGATIRREMTEQGAALRSEMADLGAALRREMADQGAVLRKEMADQGIVLRKEMVDLGGALRKEIADQGGALHKEIADQGASLVRWSFVFWVGQVLATVGIVSAMLQGLRN